MIEMAKDLDALNLIEMAKDCYSDRQNLTILDSYGQMLTSIENYINDKPLQ